MGLPIELASLATCYLLLGLSLMSSKISIGSEKKDATPAQPFLTPNWDCVWLSQGYMSIYCLSIVTCIVSKMHKLHPKDQLQTHTCISTSTQFMYIGNGIPLLCTSWDHHRTSNCRATSFDQDPILETLIADTQKESSRAWVSCFLSPPLVDLWLRLAYTCC